MSRVLFALLAIAVTSFAWVFLITQTSYFAPDPVIIEVPTIVEVPTIIENVTYIPVETVIEKNIPVPAEILSDPIRREQLVVIPGESIESCALRMRNYTFTDAEFVAAVQRQVLLAMHYKFYVDPRPVDVAWQEKSGDCTDSANIIVAMLKYGGISAHTIHGVTLSHGKLHDRLRVTFDVDGTGVPTNDFKYIGEGVW